jgi:hypothetical protein
MREEVETIFDGYFKILEKPEVEVADKVAFDLVFDKGSLVSVDVGPVDVVVRRASSFTEGRSEISIM